MENFNPCDELHEASGAVLERTVGGPEQAAGEHQERLSEEGT